MTFHSEQVSGQVASSRNHACSATSLKKQSARFLMACLISSLGLIGFAQPVSAKPNIVLIMFDDLGVNDIGAYTFPSKENPGPPPADRASGVSGIVSPNQCLSLTPRIDSLAEDGIRMTHFYASEPVCSASRASLMTGCYSRRTQINNALGAAWTTGLNSTEVTLPELLRENGYTTAMAGKWHLGSTTDFNPRREGFQRYLGILYSNDMWPQNPYSSAWPTMYLMQDEAAVSSYTTKTGYTINGAVDTDDEQSYLLEAMTEHALDSIDLALQDSKPFFLYFSPHAPHVPVHPHPDFLTAQGKVDKVQCYLDQVAEIDYRIGQILDKLADPDGNPETDDSIVNNTLVILTSDNGPWHSRPTSGIAADVFQGAGSAYPFYGAKHTNWEGGHRVGMLARYPGVLEAGKVLDQTAANLDLMPTLVRLVGGKVPDDRDIDGVDLWPLLTQTDLSEPHDKFYFYGSGVSQAGGVLDLSTPHKYKLINSQLFALGTGFTEDFQETTDVSTSNGTLKSTLENLVSSWNLNMTPREAGNAGSVRIELEEDGVAVTEGGTASVRVKLSGSAAKTVTVSRFSGDDDLSVASGGSLTFTTANWNTWQTVTFAAAEDADDISSGATFRASGDGMHVREIFVREQDTSAPAPPVAPAGLVAKAGDSGVSLDWDTNSEDDAVSYTVYRSATEGGTGEVLATGVINSNYFDSTAVTGTTYYYFVKAVDSDSFESQISESASVLAGETPPAAPTGLVVTPDGFMMALDWNDSTDFDLATYSVYRSTSIDEVGVAIAVELTSSEYVDETAIPGVVYFYRVTATDVDGNESEALSPVVMLAGPRYGRVQSVLYHRFDGDPGDDTEDPATVLFDRSSQMNDGTPAGQATYSTDVFGDEIPRELLSNKTSFSLKRSSAQYAVVPDSDSLDFGTGSAFTIEAWVKLSTLGSSAESNRQYLVIKKSGALTDANLNYAFMINTSGSYGDSGTGRRMALLLGNGSTSSAVFSTFEVADTDWHFVAVRFDDTANKVRFTLDDQNEDITSVTQTIAANTSSLIIGAHHVASGSIGSYFDGKIDELRISRSWLEDGQLLNAPGPTGFKITEVHPTGDESSQVTLTFNSIDERTYAVYGSDDLLHFTEVATVEGVGSSTTISFDDPDAVGKSRRFYTIAEK
ncbi:sulfatase-like hydrolase/transferase [Luteolibacter pohnpeiensis]|uniref:Sulfatase-like hydrolase/transferase n=1 Tax=Luteolibacter pohnpeiensis TaxID=454153 RepID=A0A934S2U5_9BACT|nr:sulfatase-like hydrolase/transferase [Luteolibacter pohnpeiensis]MBK1881312.1 sulfatase-like hydrolase/transferase [Luteolibacter pohnpeiensis]